MAALVSSFAGPAVADEVAHVARAITGKSIKNNSVTGRDVKNASLSGKDLSSKARAALRGRYRSARPGWSRGGDHADRGTASSRCVRPAGLSEQLLAGHGLSRAGVL
jgi:hypothetical protein